MFSPTDEKGHQPHEKKSEDKQTIDIEEFQLGIWHTKVQKDKLFDFWKHFRNFRLALPLFRRLSKDIYHIAPWLFTLFIISQVWQGVEDAIQMHYSTRLLRAVEAGLIQGKPDSKEILSSIGARLLCSFLVAYFRWHGQKSLEILRTRVTRHFELYLLRAKLKIDLPTSQDLGSQRQASARQVWQSLEQIVSFLTQMLRVISQLTFLTNLSRTAGGPFFTLLSICQPLFLNAFQHEIWDKVCFAVSNNKYYDRMKSLEKLTSKLYRQDVISGGLGEWITGQYEESHKNLGEVSDNSLYTLYGMRSSPVVDVFLKILGDLPMVYCALYALFNPGMFSVASFAILQQSSTSLLQAISIITYQSQQFRQSISAMKAVYAAPDVVNTIVAGNVKYPRTDDSLYAKASKGMAFELRNISFSYPGSQKTEPALKDISLDIQPGQLVVIVGANGSGKSTLIRILSRLYDPSSGDIEIDGLLSREYSIDDLHRATTLLSQENAIYPLSLAENIGLGYVEHVHDLAMIEEAAKDGGAWEFMEKLKDGVHTVLDPDIQTFQMNLYENKEHPLYAELDKVRKAVDVSGGEKQRVVAARAFMSFNSGRVKFVAVDEPSSALDAEAELNLFEKLISMREGKTVIFVTHRFGHLTKHADQIICMKEGLIVERGKHEELMNNQGEYAHLYDIQASAFAKE